MHELDSGRSHRGRKTNLSLEVKPHVFMCKCATILGVETQNLTLRVPKPLLLRAKQLANERGTSISSLVIESLTRVTNGDEAYQQAWQRQRNLMETATPRRKKGEAMPSRDDTHER